MKEAWRVCQVLVVERDAKTRQLIGSVLAFWGISQFDQARDAKETLHKIASKPYALVLLDVTIPDGSGIYVLYSVGALERGLTGKRRSLPHVIVLTELPSEELAAERLTAIAPRSVKGVVRKPIEVRKLSNAIARYAPVDCDAPSVADDGRRTSD